MQISNFPVVSSTKTNKTAFLFGNWNPERRHSASHQVNTILFDGKKIIQYLNKQTTLSVVIQLTDMKS